MKFDLSYYPKNIESATSSTLNFIFNKNQVLARESDGAFLLSKAAISKGLNFGNSYTYVVRLEGSDVFAIQLSKQGLNVFTANMLHLARPMDSGTKTAFYHSKQLLNWHFDSNFCGCCSGKISHSKTEYSKICDDCFNTIEGTAVFTITMLAPILFKHGKRGGFRKIALVSAFSNLVAEGLYQCQIRCSL